MNFLCSFNLHTNSGKHEINFDHSLFLFCVDVLCPNQQFFSHVGFLVWFDAYITSQTTAMVMSGWSVHLTTLLDLHGW